jgi:MFS family permease
MQDADGGILSPFRFRDFRLLWGSLLISNLGTWMQFTAQGYFVATISGTPHRAALNLGILGAARAIPVLLLSPLAGVVADTLPRRRVLLVTNTTMALVALAFALLASAGRLDMLWLVVISAINAGANAFDSPTRQSWVPMLVDRAHIGNAIGLNSMALNGPAVVGPAVAGILIGVVGVAGSFYVNAVATLAVVVAVVMMRPSPPSMQRREPVLMAMRGGIAFLVAHPILRWIIGVFVVTAILARPYSQLTPAYIVNTLHGSAQSLGWAVAATGVGGFGGAIVTAIFGGRERRSTQWVIAGALMSAGLVVLSLIHAILPALPVFFLMGLGTLAFMGASNTLIQTLAPDDVRGRAVSVYTMIALGGVPLGSLIVGSIASMTGLHVAFAVAGAICLVFILAAYLLNPLIRTV